MITVYHALWFMCAYSIANRVFVAYAYGQRVTVKEVMDAALKQYFADKEVDPMPPKTRNRLLA